MVYTIGSVRKAVITTTYFSAEDESVCIREKLVMILIQVFCNTCSDFHMEKTI